MTEPTSTHGDCPHCSGHGCFTEFPDGGYYCHQCEAKPKKGKQPMTFNPEEQGLTLKHLPYRGIEQSVVEFFNTQTAVDAEGNPVSRVYNYPHAPKVRVLPKDFSKNKGFTTNYLLGMDKFNAGSSKTLTIVEGEDDVSATYQMLGKKWPVVGLPGASTVKQVLKNPEAYNFISAHENIVICTDSDAAGDSAADQLQRAFPGKCYRVNMTTHKDPMEYLEAGEKSDFMYAWVNRQKYIPENVFNTPEQFTKIIQDDRGGMFIPTGIKDFDDMAGGLMQGYFTVFQAPEGVGKTELIRRLEWNLLENHPTVPFAMMHLEETKKRSLLGLASYALGQNVTLQDTEEREGPDGDKYIEYLPSYNGVPEEEVMGAITDFTSRENLYQFTMGSDEDPMSIVEQIRYFAEVCGCKYVFFEPIQDLGYNRQDDTSLEQWLSQLATKLALLATELGIGIVTIAHENDDGLVRDCRMIPKRAAVVVQLYRDKMAADEEARNTTKLTLVKNRPTSRTGHAGYLSFDMDTFTIQEKEF